MQFNRRDDVDNRCPVPGQIRDDSPVIVFRHKGIATKGGVTVLWVVLKWPKVLRSAGCGGVGSTYSVQCQVFVVYE